MRVYVLIVIKGNMCAWYVYNDGFIYYAPELFVKGSLEDGVNITSGLKDRSIYKDNPLTHKDLYQFIGSQQAKKLQNNIKDVFHKLYLRYRDELVEKNKGSPGFKFCIYGADIAPDEKLDVKIIELNKGPSLDKKDERDGDLKYSMARDAFGLLGIIHSDRVHPENFIEV
jgi:hypothetical protein